MRRLTEGPESPTPVVSGAGARPRAPWRTLGPQAAFAAACFLLAPYLGLTSRTVDPRIAEIWPPGGVGFVLLTTVWYAGRRVLGGTVAAMLAVFLTTAFLLGETPLDAVWWGVATVGQALLMALTYRMLLGRPGWAPDAPHDVASLLVATVVSSLACALAGGFPGLTAGELTTVLMWWVVRNSVFCFVGALTFMMIFHRRDGDALTPSHAYNRVWLLMAGVLCVYGTYHDPSLPLSWLLLIPSIWGGLTLTVRGAAYLGLTVALLAAVMSLLPQNHFGYVGWLPAATIVDLLVIANTAFVLLLSLMREHRARLIAALDRKHTESENQRRVLTTVFDSMTDGVILIGRDGATMHNHAARLLVGRPIPTGRPTSWVESFAVTAPDGSPIDDTTLHDTLFDAEGRATGRPLEVRVGHGDNARILEMSAQPLGEDDDAVAMLLLHDVTSQRARLRELSNFAGIVAHDLRGPLTVLDGWLEFAQDGAAAADPARVTEATDRARDASRRMRQVIEDWLGYTVVQNGQVHPEPVALDRLAAEIAETYRTRHADDAEPRFYLDLEHSVEADPAMLRQLLDNLVGNAVKYTESGTAPRIVLASSADDEAGWVRVEVTDQGVGIPEGQEEQIFEEFHRGPVRGRSASTGLGLSLTRRIVALHGGRLSARRNPEGGSTFSFTLPAA